MASTYVNNLRLEEIGSGEQSGTWGDTTNTNLELIGQVTAWGTRAIANASTDNITIADGAAMTDAHRAEEALMSGEAIGPLHGVPIAIKDLSATKGIATTYGSQLQRDNIPDHDDIIVERLKAQIPLETFGTFLSVFDMDDFP